AKKITYDYWHGQWKLDRDGNEAMFPFGFGCSYTQFSISSPAIETNDLIKFRFEVSNVGSRDGATVVQVFAGCKNSSIERPKRRLVAFKRVELRAGETKHVECTASLQSLATRDTKTHGWFVEQGSWNFEIAQFQATPRPCCSINRFTSKSICKYLFDYCVPGFVYCTFECATVKIKVA
ncbi:MAG: hypothetical protein EBQ54_00050, partial [Actinobacteria bacterium]|nr:hypothetical protein [Actinomycetota bacterium]